jgi:hypothetical protein|tara:strand:- start:1340 stop:1630 length:291 start_codon:yes stop_codon:yes gene_type:complete
MTTETTTTKNIVARMWDKIECGKLTQKTHAAISLDNRIGNTYSKWIEKAENATDEEFLNSTRDKLREAMLKLTADEIDLLDTLIFIANGNPSNPNV